MSVTPINANAASWTTSGSGSTRQAGQRQPYSPNNFYTAARDTDGSEVMRIKVPVYMARELVRMANSNDYPDYDSHHDIIRDALVHRYHYLLDNLATPQMQIPLRVSVDRLMDEQYVVDMEKSIDRAHDYVQSNITQMTRALDCQMWDHLAGLIWRARKHMDSPNVMGTMYADLVKVCDELEPKIPEEFRRPYLG